MVAVTHDRYFLDNVAGWILELDRGAGIPWEGNYSSWLEQKQARLAGEEKADKARAGRPRSASSSGSACRPGPASRKGKARINAYNDLVAEAEAAERRADTLEIAIPPGPRLGDRVVDAEGVTKGYGDRLLIDDLSFLLPPGGIVGVIGPNGAGKTTLFRMIVGRGEARRRRARGRRDGRARPTSTSRATTLDPDNTVFEEITGGRRPHRGRQPRAARPGLRRQLRLQGQRPAEEGRRSSPAASATASSWPRCCKSGGNVLLLDEPTNDLDVDTLRALEEALLGFPGCAVVISHDRWFLDRIATHVLAFEGDSEVRWCEGNFSDYEADRQKRLGVDADQPHRIRYKPLVRD